MVTSTHQDTPAWPFLVGRGRHQGYRTLLAPGFLVEQDMYETLSAATPSVAPGVLGQAEITCAGLGRLALTYTTESISCDGAGGPDRVDEWLDEHGRPLEMLYGVVAHEPLSHTLAISDLSRAREDAHDAYRTFLADEDDFSVCVSQPYSLPRQAPGRRQNGVVAPDEQRQNARPGDRHRPEYRGRGAIALTAFVVLIVAAGVWLMGRGSTSANVSIIAAGARPANGDTCYSATQLSLQASLSAADGVRIHYRWVPTGALAADSPMPDETVTIRGGSQTVTDIRDASAAPYRLIIDGPVSRRSAPVTCRSSPAGTPTSYGSSETSPY